jgi:hypothetical protein
MGNSSVCGQISEAFTCQSLLNIIILKMFKDDCILNETIRLKELTLHKDYKVNPILNAFLEFVLEIFPLDISANSELYS